MQEALCPTKVQFPTADAAEMDALRGSAQPNPHCPNPSLLCTAGQWVWMVMQHCSHGSTFQVRAELKRAAHVVKPPLNLSQFNPVCSDSLPELFVLLGSNNLKAQMVPGRNQNKLNLSRTENSYVEVLFYYLFGVFFSPVSLDLGLF